MNTTSTLEQSISCCGIEFLILIASGIKVAEIIVLFHNPAISLKRLSLITPTEFFRISKYPAGQLMRHMWREKIHKNGQSKEMAIRKYVCY